MSLKSKVEGLQLTRKIDFNQLFETLAFASSFRKPPRPRRPACSAGWTGKDAVLGEVIGGRALKAAVKKLDLARDGFSPVYIGTEKPSTVKLRREPYEGPQDPERYWQTIHGGSNRPLSEVEQASLAAAIEAACPGVKVRISLPKASSELAIDDPIVVPALLARLAAEGRLEGFIADYNEPLTTHRLNPPRAASLVHPIPRPPLDFAEGGGIPHTLPPGRKPRR